MRTKNPSRRSLLALCACFALSVVSSAMGFFYLYPHIQEWNERIMDQREGADRPEKAMQEERGPGQEVEGPTIHLIPIEEKPHDDLVVPWEQRKPEK